MSDDLIVFARNREEMQTAQVTTVAWADRKLSETSAQLTEMEQNIEEAKAGGFKVEGFRSAASVIRNKYRFYEKLKAALEAGYVIIPNFPIDVFAIRTAREYPVGKYVENSSVGWDNTDLGKQGTDRPALGEGEYHSDHAVVRQEKHTRVHDDKGQPLTRFNRWLDGFQEVDFPVKFVRPSIVNETSRALSLKIFDEIGILPERRQKSDPMIIGQIVYKRGWQEKRVSFLITWWLRESDLTV
jgi:hypothetical protein